MSDEGQDTLKKYIEIDPLQASQEALQQLMLNGDLNALTMQQRAEYVYHYAVSKGLDPASKPFDLIVLNGKLTLYANRSASDQIRKRDGITTERLYFGPLRCGVDGTGSQVYDQTVWEVEYKLSDREGRVEFSTGCVGVENMKGDSKGNAVMKADTKAKRRGTLAMGGLGIADESEVESFGPRQDIGEGKPRRVYPRAIAATSAEPLPDVDDMPIIESTLVDEAPVPSESIAWEATNLKLRLFDRGGQPPAATPQSAAARPPAFPRLPTAKMPVKPPVKV